MNFSSSNQSSYVLYDFMQVAGGAERVTLQMAQRFPVLRPVVSRVYVDAAPMVEVSGVYVHTLADKQTRWLGRIPEAVWCFWSRGQLVRDASVVVYSGFYAPLAVRHQKQGRKVYYCHTIPRFAYDLYELEKARFPWYLRSVYAVGIACYRYMYKRAINRMDVLLVNSENVRHRMQRYLGLETQVLYPPVATKRFRWMADDGYYLSVARLTANKRVEVAVKAFAAMPHRRLMVMSGGPELLKLQQLAIGASNIEFVGWQSEEDMLRLIGRCRAVVYLPIDEDFGMSPVEAMAAGKPVLGVAEGGLLETVLHGETGVLMEGDPTPEKLVAAVESLDVMDSSRLRAACEARAKRFDETVFFEKLNKVLAPSHMAELSA